MNKAHKAFLMERSGKTYLEIAEALKIRPERVSALVSQGRKAAQGEGGSKGSGKGRGRK
jgi:hypothetical protein